MMKADIKLSFVAEGKTIYRQIDMKPDYIEYPFATPRKKKNPDDQIIQISRNQYSFPGRPQYFVKNGIGEHISGIFYDPEKRKGYGGSLSKKDTYLFDWDIEAGRMNILILLNASNETIRNDVFWYNAWLKGSLSDTEIIHRQCLDICHPLI